MAGEYTEITLVAPSSAEAGTEIEVSVIVKNISDLTIYVIPVLTVDGEPVGAGSYETIIPGGTHSWVFSLTMPSSNIMVAITGWLETYQVDWHADYTVEQGVILAGNGELPPGNGEVPPGTLDINNLISPLITIMIVMMMMKMIMTGTMGKVG